MQFQIGPLKVSKIFELDSIYLPMKFAFPAVSADILKKLRRWYWAPILAEDPEASRLELFLHSYLIRMGGKNILIDTCAGNHKERSIPFFNQLETPYIENLRALGITPEEIDLVLCTHLHFDHVGWNTRLEDGRWVPTFPNAKYLFTKADFDYFNAHRKDPMYGPAFMDSVLPIIEHGCGQIIETDFVVENEIDEGLWFRPAPGHSAGSSMVCARKGGQEIIFSGDTFHHPIQLAAPELLFSGDEDGTLASATRRALFEERAGTGTVIFPAHFGESSGGRIERFDEAYQFAFIKPSA